MNRIHIAEMPADPFAALVVEQARRWHDEAAGVNDILRGPLSSEVRYLTPDPRASAASRRAPVVLPVLLHSCSRCTASWPCPGFHLVGRCLVPGGDRREGQGRGRGRPRGWVCSGCVKGVGVGAAERTMSGAIQGPEASA